MHRRHWYAYGGGGDPVHVPGDAVSVEPSCAVPLIVGGDVFAGAPGTGATSAVCAEDAVDEPTPFDAVTTTRIVAPTSAVPRRYDGAVSSPMSAQPFPFEIATAPLVRVADRRCARPGARIRRQRLPRLRRPRDRRRRRVRRRGRARDDDGGLRRGGCRRADAVRRRHHYPNRGAEVGRRQRVRLCRGRDDVDTTPPTPSHRRH